MDHALPPENGDFLVELELLFILFRFGPLRSKDNVSQRNVPRGLEREETAVLAGYSGNVCHLNSKPGAYNCSFRYPV